MPARFGRVVATFAILGAMSGLPSATAAHAGQLPMKSAAITPEALSSEAFAQLIELEVDRKVEVPRIRHGYEAPKDPNFYSNAVETEARPLTEDRLNVRVVYGSFLPDEEPIDFLKDPQAR